MLLLKFVLSCALLVAALPVHSGFPSNKMFVTENLQDLTERQETSKVQQQDLSISQKPSIVHNYGDIQPSDNDVKQQTPNSRYVPTAYPTRVKESRNSKFGYGTAKESFPNSVIGDRETHFGQINEQLEHGDVNLQKETGMADIFKQNEMLQIDLTEKPDQGVSKQEGAFDPYSRTGQIQRYLAVLEPLIKTTHDFSYVAPEVMLMLDEKHLNVKHLRLTISDAMKLYHYLHGERLSERMYVWGQSALLSLRSKKHRGTATKPIFQIETLDKFEGDIIFDRSEIDRIMREISPQAVDSNPSDQNSVPQQRDHRVRRKVTSDDTRYWSGPIPWKIDDLKFTAPDVEIIRAAIRHWESLTCVRFQDITDDSVLNKIAKDKPINRTVSLEDVRRALSNRVYLGFPKGQGRNPPESTDPKAKPQLYFKRDSGCYSYLGKFGTGQDISIGPGCEEMGIVAHELGHAIGFYHEHDRPDRDLYLTINQNNIQNDHRKNFAIKIWKDVLTLGIPYDVSSLMHYSAIEWSKDEKVTLNTKDPEMQKVIGQRQGLSFLDVKLANYQFCSFGCRGHFSLDWTECQNGGYRNPNSCDECMCPSGWSPPKCQDVEVGRNVDCLQTSLIAAQDQETLKSPKFDDQAFGKDAFCAWHITAPADKRIKLIIAEKFHMEYDQVTCEQYVEVRYKDMTRPGPRLCSSSTTTHEFISYGNQVMLLFHVHPHDTEDNNLKFFEANYQITDGCGGCPDDQTAESVPACKKIEIYDCSQDEPERQNSCYREANFCCGSYVLSGDLCQKPLFRAARLRSEPWGSWSDWSTCSGTCGGCGWRSRERQCLGRRCRGDSLEWERCGSAPCPLPKVTPDMCEVETLETCRNGTRRRPCIQTRLEPCPADHLTRRCCSGLTEDQSKGQCVPVAS